MEEQELNTLIKLFRTVFYLAKSERSSRDPRLVEVSLKYLAL